jgi:subtilisin family serine protease
MGDGVIGVIALGPSKTKADYSNWGVTYGEVSAPGGWFRDGFGTPTFRTNENQILSTYPRNVGVAAGRIDPATGNVIDPSVIKDCSGGTCGYYQWLQGTSMASPHAAGVAALIVSRYGQTGPSGGFGLVPDLVAQVLFRTATDTPCPANPVIDYLDEGRDPTWTATCVGPAARNNIYGHGIVDAYAAVTAIKGRL